MINIKQTINTISLVLGIILLAFFLSKRTVYLDNIPASKKINYLSICQSLQETKTDIPLTLITNEFKQNWEMNKLIYLTLSLQGEISCSIFRGWGGNFLVKIEDKRTLSK